MANENSSTGLQQLAVAHAHGAEGHDLGIGAQAAHPGQHPHQRGHGDGEGEEVGQQVEQDLENGPGRRPLGDQRLGEDEDLVDQQGEGVDQQPDGERGGDLLQDIAVEGPFHPEIIAQPPPHFQSRRRSGGDGQGGGSEGEDEDEQGDRGQGFSFANRGVQPRRSAGGAGRSGWRSAPRKASPARKRSPAGPGPRSRRRRHNRPSFAEHGIEDVAAVQLADGKEIEGRGQQAEPAGESHGVDQQVALRRAARPAAAG